MTYWWGCHYLRKLSRILIWCAFNSVSNINRCFGNRKWVCPICIHTHLINNLWWKHKLKIIIRIKKSKELLYVDHYGGISIFQPLCVNWSTNIYLKYKLFIFSSLCMLVSMAMLQFLNALTCSLITPFFRCIKLHQILTLFSTINNKSCIFAGNLYPWERLFKFEINIQYIYKVYCRE